MDIGCGKGRIICFFAAERRMRRVIGIELDKDIYEAAVENSNNLKVKKTQINIFHADAVNFTGINDVTIFVIFNPFGEKTLTKVIKNIEKSLKVNARAIHIAYFPTPNLARLFNALAVLSEDVDRHDAKPYLVSIWEFISVIMVVVCVCW